MSENKFTKGRGKSHLDKDFLEELKHKLWSTRGSRFQASERLKAQSKFSFLSISILSAYLIIFGLLSVYNLYNPQSISHNLIPFSITSISILILVFSLYENSKNYSVRALKYHTCGLEISKLYNELQAFKSYDKEAETKDRKDFSLQLQERYQKLLDNHENHDPIDNDLFKSKHCDYYDEIKWYHNIEIKLRYFYLTYFWYILAMLVPTGVLIFVLTEINS